MKIIQHVKNFIPFICLYFMIYGFLACSPQSLPVKHDKIASSDHSQKKQPLSIALSTEAQSYSDDNQAVETPEISSNRTVYNIKSHGACAIQGMTPRQAQTIALQRARSSAIDKACGSEITSSRVVTNGELVLDFIRTYNKGYIVRETELWHPVQEYQPDQTRPPEIEYRVTIEADVYIPKKQQNNIGLEASLNKSLFIKGERAILTINARQSCKIGVFNIQADDKVLMLHPHRFRSSDTLIPNHEFVIDNLFPEPLDGEDRNIEALFIIGLLASSDIDFQSIFSDEHALDFSEFFKRYASFSDQCIDMILTYEVAR